MKVRLKEIAVPYTGDVPPGAVRRSGNTFLVELGCEPSFPTHIYVENELGEVTGHVSPENLIQALSTMLGQYETFYETLLATMDDAVTVVDEHGHVLALNEKMASLYQLQRAEVEGKPLDHFFDQEALMLQTVMRDKKPVRHAYNQPKPDVHVIVSTVPVFIGDQCIGGMSIERDITDVVRLNDELSHAAASLHDLSQADLGEHPFSRVIGHSEKLQQAITLATKVAKTDANVLITGESGVGKELFAEGIHQASPRKEAPFVAINCGAIPTALFESELFGYVQGAFTGAVKGGKQGKFAAAKGGTLFLDEIGEMPLELQVKLLRVLQERAYYPVGGNEAVPLDVRIIAATNRSLEQMIQEGRFREDLYYRLHVISIHIPPLRERLEDLPALIQCILKEFALKYDKELPRLDPEVMYTLSKQKWEGNVRQLRNLLERVVILNGDTDEPVRLHDLPETFQRQLHSTPQPAPVVDEQSRIAEALQTTFGNKTAAAKLLGISRATLYNKMKQWDLE
ncbi:sigma 54-interacting transcriptional regulator [Bacillus sp. FSL W7-1360]